ncbi:rubredoxin [Prochlorococcus marinus]|uniref:rubredoxin n=1 Tax=Prochlorococcus marinus TaxID=1219 RepID=UPI0022B55193|nr:rubredoxin [Prochlorococcus marinus]
METTATKQKYQCKDCIYAYNPKTGDPSQGIPPGTAFEDLPDGWICPLCKASKARFRKLF